nr:BMP family ABC transporter substrate-binding protein [Ardenticatenales bacterium]
VSTVFGRMEIPRYLSGIVAGSATESNIIGYVAAFDIPEVVRGINAFTLGVRSVNPEAEVHVTYTNTWFDPPRERTIAQALLDQGADVIAQHQDSTEPQKAARDTDTLSIGYHSDMSRFVGESVLTSPVWTWEEKYTEIVQQVLDGSYQSESYYGVEVVKLAPFSSLVESESSILVEAQDAAIRAGTADVFCGPILSNTGVLVVAEGKCLTDAELLSMDWYVEGVVGDAPAQAKEGLGESSNKIPAWKISE